MTVEKFYKDKFALVIDLRSHEQVNKTAHGKKIMNTQNGVLLDMEKKAHTGNINCNISQTFQINNKFFNRKHVSAYLCHLQYSGRDLIIIYVMTPIMLLQNYGNIINDNCNIHVCNVLVSLINKP